jgi:hypothetical protein
MKTITLRALCANSSIPAKLIRATVKQCGDWANFKDMAQDVTNNGAAGGFCGFIYYRDTLEFYARNRASILSALESLADDLGEGGAIDLVRGFNCLHPRAADKEIAQTLYGSKWVHDTQVANALAWFALEEVSRAYCDALEG